MPIPNYSVCKGHPRSAVVQGGGHGKPPHLHIRLHADHQEFDIAINIQSSDLSHIRYLIRYGTTPAQAASLISLTPGIHRLTGDLLPLRLDYIRQQLVSEEELTDLPIFHRGQTHLQGELGQILEQAQQEADAVMFAFGSQFGDTGVTGIHDTHMKQGNPHTGDPNHDFFKDNGTYQDGAVYFYFPSTQKWIELYTAFHTQHWHTDDNGNPLPDTPAPHEIRFSTVANPNLQPTRRFFFARPTTAREVANNRRFINNDFIAPPIRPEMQPYRKSLAQFYHELNLDSRVQRISQAQKMVFHCVGDTGAADVHTAQDAIAHAMTEQVHGANAIEDQPAFFYHLGDVVYTFGENAYYRQEFYERYIDYPSPIFAIPGNHDGYQRNDPSLVPFMQQFCARTPHESPQAGHALRLTMTQPNPYWTLQTPLATIIGLYSNTNGSLDDLRAHSTVQRDWLKGELEAAPTDRWLIVAVHHPPYNLGHHGGSLPVLNALSSAVDRARRTPDLVLSGHEHNYQRFQRDWNGKLVPFLVAGAGGHVNYDIQAVENPDLPLDPGVTKEHVNDALPGFLRFTLTATTLLGEYFVVQHRPHHLDPPTMEDSISLHR